MEVFAKSKNEFDDILSQNNINDDNVENYSIAFISILSPSKIIDSEKRSFFAKPYFKKEHSNVLIMEFEDIEREIEGYKAFSIELAEKTIKFIMENKDKDIFLVHCAAGISRSGAIAQFINDYFSGDYETFHRNNPHILPNNLITRLLGKAYKKILKTI